jgi:hypothetical protein
VACLVAEIVADSKSTRKTQKTRKTQPTVATTVAYGVFDFERSLKTPIILNKN